MSPAKRRGPKLPSCDACPSGSYAKDSGSPICSPADKGYYVSKNDRTKQIPCDAGRYSPGSGATECAKCPLGTYAKSKNADRCEPARPGWHVDEEGASAEKECEAGFYTSDEGQSACLPATPGTKVPTDGWSKDPEKCEPGKHPAPARGSARRADLVPTPRIRAPRAATSRTRAPMSPTMIGRHRSSATRAILAGSRRQRVHCMFAWFLCGRQRRHELRVCSGWVLRARAGIINGDVVREGQLHRQPASRLACPQQPGTKVPTKGWSKKPEKCPEGTFSESGAERCEPCGAAPSPTRTAR